MPAAYRQAQAFPHPAPVVGMLEIPVVKRRLDSGIGRGQPDVSGAVGQSERTRDACHPVRGHVTVQVPGPYTGDALLPCVETGLVRSTMSLLALDPSEV